MEMVILLNGPWVEKYRPKTLDEVVGQDHTISRLKRYVKEGNMPNLMFTGPGWCGKNNYCHSTCKGNARRILETELFRAKCLGCKGY